MTDPNVPAADPHGVGDYDKSFFGHPRGLPTLFFTRIWERFSYCGMRALTHASSRVLILLFGVTA